MIDLTSGVRTLTADRIVESVISQRPQFLEVKDNNVEYAKGFPNMMMTLWSYIVCHRKFPTQMEFVEHFMRTHSNYTTGMNLDAVKARVMRTYASCMREIHFYFLVKDSGLFNRVLYSADLDAYKGVDLQIELGGHQYNVCCFLATKRSVEFREEKKTRRHEVMPNTIEVTLDLQQGTKREGWVFFDYVHVHTLHSKVLNYAWEHYEQHPLELMTTPGA